MSKPQTRTPKRDRATTSLPDAARTADDRALLSRVCTGDRDAWNTFFVRFRGLLIHCATRVFREAGVRLPADDVFDVVSDICLNMIAHDFRRLRLFRPDGGSSVSSWIGVIATSTSRDFLRRERRRRWEPVSTSDLEAYAMTTDGPESSLLEREQRTFVDAAFARMSPRDRTFAEMYFADARTPDDIAKEMGISLSTVYSKKAKIKVRPRALAAATAA